MESSEKVGGSIFLSSLFSIHSAIAIFGFLALYPLSERVILLDVNGQAFVSCALSFVRRFDSAGRGAVGSADIHFAKGIICVDILILCPNDYFHWARGANARGRTIERGKSSLRSGLPSP